MKLPLRDFADVITAMKEPAVNGLGAEKRRVARMSVVARVNACLIEHGQIGRRYTALAQDISLGGLGMLQSAAVPVGQELILTLPRTPEPIFVAAKVLRCSELADGLMAVGVEFTRVLDRELAQKVLGRPASADAPPPPAENPQIPAAV
jgi:hypothetical protein